MTDWHRSGMAGATEAWQSKRTTFAAYYVGIVGDSEDAGTMREGVIAQAIQVVGAFLEAGGTLYGDESASIVNGLGDRHRLQLGYESIVELGTPENLSAWRRYLLAACDQILATGCVTFAAPTPQAEKPQKVEIVGLPARQTTSVIERDHHGEISRTVQTEQDARR